MKRFFEKIIKKKSVSVICTVLFAALVGGYVISHLLGGFSEKLTITPATVATENTYETYDAFIFRDENIITSKNSGYRLDILEDGEMAGIGTECARVYPASAREGFDGELSALDAMIALMERCCVSLTSSGIESARSTLRTGYFEIAEALSSNNAAGAVKIKEQIIDAQSVLFVNTGTSEAVSENISLLREQINELKNKRKELVDSLGTAYEGIFATKTGYYYSGTDGYEALMSSAEIDKKSYSELMASINAKSNGETHMMGGIGKMVYDPHWYAALPVDMSVAVKYLSSDGSAKNQSYTVGVYNGEWREVKMALERVVQSPEDGRAILIFSSSVMEIGFDIGRECRVRIHTGEYEGYRVPIRALHQKDGKLGVYVLTYGTVEWKYVEEIYRGDTYILAKRYGADDAEASSYLAHNDSLIVEGNDLYDGKTVD